MAASVHLQCPSGLLDLTHECAALAIRGRLVREVQRVFANSSEAQRRGHAPMARASGRVRGQATIGARERHDGRARVLETLAEERWRGPQHVGSLRFG